MRTMLMALALAGAAASGTPIAQAEITYPWCAPCGEQGGARNCGFATLDQCRAALSGNGGYCDQNPMHRPGVESQPVSRRPRR
jgi:Protein of unknown function (DUF3551)